MSDQPAADAPTIEDCLRLLERIAVPPGQQQLYRALLAAGSNGATTQELVSAMGRRDEQDLSGVLGALGHRVNGTPGYGKARKPGVLMILQIDKADEGWRYRLKPVMREALATHAPPWLPENANSKAMRLLAFVRSRFPGWRGFEDPRFNKGPLDEVGYKLATRERAKAVLSYEALSELLAAGQVDEFVDRLVEVGSETNLLWQPKARIGDLSLLRHDGLDRASYCRMFFDLLYGDGDAPDRLDRYVDWVSSQGLDSMNRWTLPTYFLFFLDAENEMFVKPTATRNFLKLGGWDIQFDAKPTGGDYARIRDAYRELREVLVDYGPRHMIDVQSFGWIAQEEAERQRKAREEARSKEFDLDPAVESAMASFEQTADGNHLIRQAERLADAQERFQQDFGSEAKLRSLDPETFVDLLSAVDARSSNRGLFSLNVVATKDPTKAAFQHLQEDLPALRAALTALLHGDGTRAERVDAAWASGKAVRNYITEGMAIASAFLFVQDPDTSSGVLPISKKREKLQQARLMPQLGDGVTLGEQLDGFETALTNLPTLYGRLWTPEIRKQFYFSEPFMKLAPNKPPPPPPPPPAVTFADIARGLRDEDLHFSREAVANYVLALQAKRFAILTGISGTGKTRIAMAVAHAFRVTIRDRQTLMLKAARSPNTAGFGETGKPEADVENILRLIAGGRVWIDKGGMRTQLTVKEVLGTPRLELDHDKVLRPQGIRVRAHEKAVYVAYESPLMRERVANTIFPNWKDSLLNGLPTVKLGGQHRFGKERFYTVRIPFHLLGVGQVEEESDQPQFKLSAPETRTAERELVNWVVVPVRPDWVDNRGLLGYFNPLTNEYTTTPFLSLLLEAQAEVERAGRERRDPHPFFVVLDEMNLARVEHYFSDFLSALESDEAIPLHVSEEVEEGGTESGTVVPRQLRVPSNVFFTGTVNVDETTYMFSPKVLDRAFTIEFDRVDLRGYTRGRGSDQAEGLKLDGSARVLGEPYRKPGRKDWLAFVERDDGLYETLLELHAILEGEHRHFGYRVANEIARFVNLAREHSSDPKAAEHAFDLALLQKVLPKFHGTQQELEPILRRLFRFAVHGGDVAQGDGEDFKLDNWEVENGRLVSASDPPVPEGGDGGTPTYPRTAAKVWRMLRRLNQRGFAGFIE